MTEVVESLVGGRWCVEDGASCVADRNPARLSEILADVPQSSEAFTARAVAAAADALPAWRATSPLARGKILLRTARVLADRAEELARVMTAEQGKPLPESRGEVARVIDFCEWMGGQGGAMAGVTAPSENPDLFAYTMREPVGVVGLITPWNFPLNIPNWKLASALLHGNTVVLKASDLTARCAQELARCYEQGGVPPGVLNVVTGAGSVVGGALADHPGVAAISFTGSTSVGLSLAARLAGRGAKIQCEMGGSNPVVVCDDADLDRAVPAIVTAAYGTSGQRCTAARRVIATPAVHDELARRLEVGRAALRVGPGDRPGVDIGPLCDPRGRDDVVRSIARARDEGCQVTGGAQLDGELKDGLFVEPALVVGVSTEMELGHEEVFGPVLAIQAARDYEDAIRLANATSYGLSASIFTERLSRAIDFTRRAHAGMVHVNKGPIGGESHLPFGGTGGSSYGPKEMGAARDFYTEQKTVYADVGLNG
jgi:alpha-ketoglutaric semialdehyde dehydrogenase